MPRKTDAILKVNSECKQEYCGCQVRPFFKQ